MTNEKVTVEFRVSPLQAWILREVAGQMERTRCHGIKFLKRGLVLKLSDQPDPFGSVPRRKAARPS